MKAIIFDMDGVIFDSERAMLWSLQEVCKRKGIKDVTPFYNDCIGVTREKTVQIFQAVYGADFDVEAYMQEGSEIYHERYDGGRMPIKEGAKEILSYLKEEGYLIALASSTKRKSVERQLRDAGLLSYFPVLVCGDMVQRSKPAPDIFLCAAKELGVEPEECFVIEDSYNGIRAAASAGMKAFMVPDMLPPNEEMDRLSYRIMTNLLEVKEYLIQKEEK